MGAFQLPVARLAMLMAEDWGSIKTQKPSWPDLKLAPGGVDFDWALAGGSLVDVPCSLCRNANGLGVAAKA